MRANIDEWRVTAGRVDEWRVACAWLPQLPLRVELLRNPAREGAPLVLGAPARSGSSRPGARKVVQLASPEAEAAGIRPGLPLRDVLALCPEAIIVQPDPLRVAAALDQVAGALERVSPVVEVAGDRLYLDLRGLRTLYRGDLTRLEQAIRAAIPPVLRPRVGIAANKFTAAVAAGYPPGAAPVAGSRAGTLWVLPADTVAFLRPLPIGLLPFSADDHERLASLGLRTIADLADLPLSAVQAQFGVAGARCWRLANGQGDEPVVGRQHTPTVAVSLRADDPLASVDAVTAALDLLLARAFADPLLRARSARQARLRALLADDSSWECLVTFKEPLAGRAAVRRALRAKLDLPGGLPDAPIAELYLELLGLGAEVARQGQLFADQAVQLGRVAEAARQLSARYGQIPFYHAVEVEPWSRIPERRWALIACEL